MDDIKIAKKLISLQSSAEKRGIEFSLSFAELKRILKRKTCYYTGEKLNNKENHLQGASIDRIDNDLGYVNGNVILCTRSINSLKSNLSFKSIEKLYIQLKKRQNC